MNYLVVMINLYTGEYKDMMFTSAKSYRIWYKAHYNLSKPQWLQEEIVGIQEPKEQPSFMLECKE